MNPLWRHRLRRARFLVGGLLAACIIAVAIVLALGQLLMPLAARYPGEVASLLSSRLQRPVTFSSMEGHWQPSGPLLTLHDVGIGGRPGHPALRLPNAEVKFDFGAWFSASRHLINLRLRGVHVALQRAADGRWSVVGLAAAGHAPQQLSTGDLPGALWLEQGTVDITDVASGRHAQLQLPVVRVNNGGGGLRFSAQVQRSGARGTVQVVGRLQPGRGDGEIYVAARQADLGAVLAGLQTHGITLRQGSGSLRAWLHLADGRVDSAVLRSDVTGLHFDTPQGALDVPAWRALVQMHRTGNGMELLYDAADGGAARAAVDGHGNSLRVRAAANRLDLAPLPLVAMLPGMPEGLSRWLAGSRMQGKLEQVSLDWSARDGLRHLAAQLDGLTLTSAGGLPGVDGLDGTLRGDGEAISLELPQQSTVLRLPATFRTPLHLSRLQGALVLWRSGDGWHLATPGIDAQGDGYNGHLHGQVILPGGGQKPYMDLYAVIDHADVAAAKLFWPLSMPPKTIQWLDHALASGEVTSARAVVHGNLAHWPFLQHRGRFQAWAQVHDITLDFNKEWPTAEHIDAVADFVDDGMLITASGQSMGVQATHAVAAIPDFRDAQLTLNVEGKGDGKSMIDYVRNSPIGNRHADILKGLSLSGGGTFDFTLVLPFHRGRDFTLGGVAQLNDIGVVDPDWHLQLDHLQGQLHYDAHGMHSDVLQAVYRGEPVSLRMALGAATGNPKVPVSVDAHGRFDIPTLIRGIDVLAPLDGATHGKADFDIGVDVQDGGSGPATTTLHVDSDLRGIALDLPAPLDKTAGISMPLHMTLGLPVAGAALNLSLGDMRALARLPSDQAPLAMAVRLGTGAPGPLPAQGVRITGQTPELDVSGWGRRALALAEKGDQSGHGLLDGVDVGTQQALLFGDRFGPLHVQLEPSPDTVTLHVDGPRMLGTATLPVNGVARRGITAQLQRLYWPGGDATAANAANAAGSQTGAAAPAPAPATTSASASNASPQAAAHSIDVAPSAVPPLHFWVGDLRLGQARLGEARFESWPIADGMHIDQLRTHSKDIQLTASGNWTGTLGDNQTHMVIDFGAENLGHMLSALGFAGLFEGGQTQAHLDATWPGPPSAVSLANMDGTLKVDVSKGRIPEVKPGVGRLFGLMSVTELPRRLSLDFGDVFGKGLGFDSIRGTFRLSDGNAYTDGLHIDGAAANITISGRTGIRTKDYDQRVLVIPHIGNSLPIVGAIAGGPVGAAAGLAVQGLLGKGLNRAASARYSITGSWQHPKITLIEKKTLPAGPASAPAPIAPPVVAPPLIPTPAVPSPAAADSSAAPAPSTSGSGGGPGL